MKFRTRDPLAAALGNASLLGVGYLVLGRRRLGLANLAISLVLVSYVVAVARTWAEIVVLVWWAAVIVHGWLLAGRDARRPTAQPTDWAADTDPGPAPDLGTGSGSNLGPRLMAGGLAALVLLAFGLLRFDAVRIGGHVAKARADGDCAGVRRAQSGVWLGDRVGDAPLSGRGDSVVRVCHRLQTAATDLGNALTSGDPDDLRAAFRTFDTVLATSGNEKIVESVLNRFLRGLPTSDACDTAALTDWLRDHRPARPPLNRTVDAVRRTAPAALLGCADDQMDDESWDQAKSRFQQLVDQYPNDERVGRAKDGAELANVSGLLEGPADDRPAYCSSPAKYGNAPKYGTGINRAMFFGNTAYTDRLPKSWEASDPAHATLVVCAGDDKRGATVQTCTYQSDKTGRLYSVSFHQIAIPVKAYELRTGKLVADRTIDIGGRSCPAHLETTYYGSVDPGPDPDQYVRESDSDVRDAFRSLIIR